MGNCANKPLTNDGADPAPEEKPVETTERELALEQTLDEDIKPEAEVAAKPDDAKSASEAVEPAEPKKEEPKPVEAVAKVEEKKVEAAPAKVEAAPAKVEEKKVEAPVSDKKIEVKKA